jgi:hypothetical protein
MIMTLSCHEGLSTRTQGPPSRSYSGRDTKRMPSGAQRPTEDVEPAKVNLKPAKRSIHAGYDHSKH